MIHIWRPWKLSNFQGPPTPLSIYVQNSSTPLTLDVQFQTNFKPTANQLKENTVHVNEQNQNRNKTKSPHMQIECVLLFYLAHKQCICIIKGLLHCQTSSLSKGRFLVNNILIFGSVWCLVIAKNIFYKKIKIERPEHSLGSTLYVR